MYIKFSKFSGRGEIGNTVRTVGLLENKFIFRNCENVLKTRTHSSCKFRLKKNSSRSVLKEIKTTRKTHKFKSLD